MDAAQDSMLKAPLKVKNHTEAFLYGLRSFLGPKQFLFKPGDHVESKREFTVSKKKGAVVMGVQHVFNTTLFENMIKRRD
jgi:hypothetical protein